MQSIVVAAIRARGKLLGVLVCMWWKERRRLSKKELCLMEGIADQAAIAIVNARLYAKAEELAVQRERVRMAKELHDRLSQSVFSIGLTLDWCLHQVDDRAALRPRLEHVKREATLILDEMRQLIYRLSPETSPRIDFAGRFQRLVDNFRELSGLSVQYTVDGDLSRLNRTQQEVLLKTYQEGFANIVKHSSATHVSVELEAMSNRARFRLSDDGVGIVHLTQGDIPAGIGLTQMIGRIEDLGGRVALRPNVPSGLVVAGLLPAGES
jgi:signal transduction histidine kinase